MLRFDSSVHDQFNKPLTLVVTIAFDNNTDTKYTDILQYIQRNKNSVKIEKYESAEQADHRVTLGVDGYGTGDRVACYTHKLCWNNDSGADTGTHTSSATKYSDSWSHILKATFALAFNLTSMDQVKIHVKLAGRVQDKIIALEPDATLADAAAEIIMRKPPHDMRVNVADTVLSRYSYRVFALNGPSKKKDYGVLHARNQFPTYVFSVSGWATDDALCSIVPLADDYWNENGKNCKTFASSGEDLFDMYGFPWVQLGAPNNGNRIDWDDNFSPLTTNKSKYRTKRGVGGDGHIKGWAANDELAKHCFYRVRKGAYTSNNEAFTRSQPLVYIADFVDGSDNAKYVTQVLTNTCRGYVACQKLAALALLGGPVANRLARKVPKAKSLEETVSGWDTVGISPSIFRSVYNAVFSNGVQWTFESAQEDQGGDKDMAACPTLQLAHSPWRVEPGIDTVNVSEERQMYLIEGKGPWNLSWTSQGWSKSKAEFDARLGYSIDDKADAASPASLSHQSERVEGRGLSSIAPDKAYRHNARGYRCSIEKEARVATAACPIMSNTDCSDDNADIRYRARKIVFVNKSVECNLTDWLGLDSDKTVQIRAQWDY